MAQNDLVVVGIDVAKDKVDSCIRALASRQTFPNTVQGHRKLVGWLRKYQVNKAVDCRWRIGPNSPPGPAASPASPARAASSA